MSGINRAGHISDFWSCLIKIFMVTPTPFWNCLLCSWIINFSWSRPLTSDNIYLSISHIIQLELWILQSALSVNGNIYFFWNHSDCYRWSMNIVWRRVLKSSIKYFIIQIFAHIYLFIFEWAEISWGNPWVPGE